jgi:hypothetical protein
MGKRAGGSAAWSGWSQRMAKTLLAAEISADSKGQLDGPQGEAHR